MKKGALLVLLLIVWAVLAWPFDVQTGALKWSDMAAGLVVALLVLVLARELSPSDVALRVSPVRVFWFVAYAFFLGWYIVKANVDVAYRVLHPDMPIRPGIVKVKTALRSQAALTMLSNSITLTPGTLTVNALEDGTLYIHWIYVRTEDADEASRMIIGRFEWFLEKIFE
ncbi:MAG: Na+/H+ antiporter subunit E [Kiritimatiellae bacterium]|nr:Na+/H+ antiporter subunit E [Kiritimatiellia bacterium]